MAEAYGFQQRQYGGVVMKGELWTLEQLRVAGHKGITTAWVAERLPAFHLKEYIRRLRERGHQIITIREGKRRIGRYVLIKEAV